LDVAAKALDRFDAQMAGRFHGWARQGGDANAWEAQQLLERARHREQATGIGNALQVVLALLVQLIGLDQHRPALGLEKIAQVAGVKRKHLRAVPIIVRMALAGTGGGNFYGRQLGQAPLRQRRELTNGLDLVAKELEPVRGIRIGGKDIEDPAASAELTR